MLDRLTEIASLTGAQRAFLSQLVLELQTVSNVAAVVLGGSHARGFARPDSDLDVGIYYRESTPFAIADVRAVAERAALPGSNPVVTDFYGWGPWVNGGAWLHTAVGRVDFVYRNLEQVRTVLDEGRTGVWRHDFDQQPPFGFRSVVYFAETHWCVPLLDAAGEIAELKALVAEYPDLLRERVTQECLWGAEFTLLLGRKFGKAGDVLNAVGSMTRVAQYLVHALFAWNREYFLSDKNTAKLMEGFAQRPNDFSARLATVLGQAGTDATSLLRSFELLVALWRETAAVTGTLYQPRFDLESALLD
jgi:hypothetical protein